ncbi:MAG: PHP domain-containing protein [Chloroflexi bacterium]|nr:PHP domain-containing protein [Chloroflexota bacterium]MDE2862384.1 PHP domain-containing protein [Chloroflexota bacterium]MDE2936359.1 PHP domain-containing protein [Chloroflexota bacterium]MXW28251.1 PHP domain-containing protein [Chloroflexota bacterium]MXY00340.1 PHP domain-containing protein [Chloroflexota bacterium]
MADLVRVELHAHTWWSGDCGVSPRDLCQAARDAGIDVLAVTDHNQIGGAFEARDCGIVDVIVGEEIRTDRGELLAYFLKEWIPPRLPPIETIARIRDQGGVVSIPHPLDRDRNSTLAADQLDAVVPLLDMVEVFNSRVIKPDRNRRASELCLRNGKIPAVGSDAHTRGEVGNSWQEIPEFDGPQQFLAAMQDARLNTRRASPLARIASNWQKVRKRMFGPDVAELAGTGR